MVSCFEFFNEGNVTLYYRTNKRLLNLLFTFVLTRRVAEESEATPLRSNRSHFLTRVRMIG